MQLQNIQHITADVVQLLFNLNKQNIHLQWTKATGLVYKKFTTNSRQVSILGVKYHYKNAMVVTHNGGRKADDSDDLINLILTQFDFSVSLSMLHGI